MTERTTNLGAALASQYSIERELGRGGMATVWLAEDVRHHRKVAIKVLHPEISAVLGSERFLKEIELTAHLQHPHILPLFDSGSVNGTVYYVMPLVEGESLRDRLNREKQLPIGEAVRIATEVASALDYAHRRGVIHRDIKPENVLLHDGQALVADFGIALAASNAGATARLTETGLSLGTPSYMSPEQAMGERELTPRSDVYALGAMAYEMLAGEPPFAGPTAQAILAKVLTEEPPPLMARRRSIPEHVEYAVFTALEKLPADRFATAGEFAEALEGETSATRRAYSRERGKTGQRTAVLLRGWHRIALAGVGLVIIAAGVAAWAWAKALGDTAPTRRAVIAPSDRTEPHSADLAVSADGRTMAFVSGGQVVVKRVDRFEMIPVPGSTGADHIFLSADGKRVGYRRDRELVVQGIDGSAVVSVPFATGLFPTDGGEGRVIAVDQSDLVVIDLASERRHLIARAPPGVALLDPILPPRGKHVLVTAVPNGSVARAQILAVGFPSGGIDTLVDGGALGAQVADGYLYYARPDGSLYAVGYDARRARTVGKTVATGDVAVTQRTGRVAFAAGAGLVMYGERWLTRVIALTPGGGREVLTNEPSTYHNPRMSPDGRRIAFDLDLRGQRGRDVWILDLSDRTVTRLTSKGDAHDPVWTPDGRRITYLSLGTPGGPIFTTSADGAGHENAIALPGRVVHPGQWLADGSGYVAGVASAESDPSDIAVLAASGASTKPMVTSPYNEHSPTISPDGRWLAYVSNETGSRQVYVRSVTGSGRALVSEAVADEPVWSRDGPLLYYVEHRDTAPRLMAARIGPGNPPIVTSRTVIVEEFDHEGVRNHANWDVAPDGRIILVESLAGGRWLMVTDWRPSR